jgi:3-hydroxyacyl-CoA dehydrogenase
MDINSVCVAGGGVMGLGILRGFAAHGVECWLLSRDPAAYRAFAAQFVARMLALQAEAEAARIGVAPAPRAHPQP